MNISDISQRYIGIYLVKGRKNMHQEMSNSTTKESFGEEIKYRASHLNSGIKYSSYIIEKDSYILKGIYFSSTL